MDLRALLLCGAALAAPAGAWARSVALVGILGNKALLVIDGAAPRIVGPGQSRDGIKVITAGNSEAVVELDGVRQTLRLGEAPLNADNVPDAADARKIVLHAGSLGHFSTSGQINGRAVTFLVDTGASFVVLSAGQADNIGLKYRSGRPVQMNTANGTAPGWIVKLDSIRVGSVDVYNVDAVVNASPMPYVLLGNSYLTHFQMTRTNDQLVLDKRF